MLEQVPKLFDLHLAFIPVLSFIIVIAYFSFGEPTFGMIIIAMRVRMTAWICSYKRHQCSSRNQTNSFLSELSYLCAVFFQICLIALDIALNLIGLQLVLIASAVTCCPNDLQTALKSSFFCAGNCSILIPDSRKLSLLFVFDFKS